MKELSATDAARRFSELLDAVEHRHESFTVVRRGRAVATISPSAPANGRALKAVLRKNKPDESWARELRELRAIVAVEARDWRD